MSAWLDITRPIDESLITWPGRAQPHRRWEKTIQGGAHCNVSHWELNAHSGTHMDAPLHFVAGGKSIDQIPPDVFLGPCRLVDLSSPGALFDERAADELRGVQRLLIRTEHSTCTAATGYWPHGPLMNAAAANVLLAGGLRLIGTDRLSVDDSAGQDYALHHAFLGAGCVIVEGLLLTALVPGAYQLLAAPLRMSYAEASPIRAFCSPV